MQKYMADPFDDSSGKDKADGILEYEALPRRVMTLFVLVDTSGSMAIDGNIGKVNRAIEEAVQQLRDVSSSNFDAEIRIAVLEFSSGCRWVTDSSEALEDFVWNDLTAGGLTDMGAAFTELESALSRTRMLQSSTGAYAPVIILLSDGQPTDNIAEGLDKLRNNNWFKNAMKIAVAVTSEASDALVQFTGNVETVLPYDGNKQDLCKLLTRLMVVSSKIQSRSKKSIAVDPDEETRLRSQQEFIASDTHEVLEQVLQDMEEDSWDDDNW